MALWISPPVPHGPQEQSNERGPYDIPISQSSKQRIIWAAECQLHMQRFWGVVSSLKDPQHLPVYTKRSLNVR